MFSSDGNLVVGHLWSLFAGSVSHIVVLQEIVVGFGHVWTGRYRRKTPIQPLAPDERTAAVLGVSRGTRYGFAATCRWSSYISSSVIELVVMFLVIAAFMGVSGRAQPTAT